MLKQLKAQAESNQKASGNHINYEITKLAQSLGIDELSEIAQESGNKRMLRQIEKYNSGNLQNSEAGHLNNLRIMAEGQISRA